MAIGGSLLLILAGVLVASGPGARPGLLDVRYAGMSLAGVGLVVLAVAIGAWYRRIWERERRRETYARLRAASTASPTVQAARPARARPAVAGRYRRRPLRQYAAGGVAAPEPTRPLSVLGQVPSLVDHTQMPGQHGKLPPSPLGRLRYPW